MLMGVRNSTARKPSVQNFSETPPPIAKNGQCTQTYTFRWVKCSYQSWLTFVGSPLQRVLYRDHFVLAGTSLLHCCWPRTKIILGEISPRLLDLSGWILDASSPPTRIGAPGAWGHDKKTCAKLDGNLHAAPRNSCFVPSSN